MTFDGFVPPVDDYFRMPNEWINICAEIDSLAEMKVVQYVLRHTWGYQGFSGARKITIDEFMHGRKRKDGSRIDNGTGLSKQSVITGTGLAIEHGYLKCDKDDKDLARQKKYYQLAMKSDVKPLDTVSDVKNLDIQSDVKNLDISDVKNLDPDVKNLDSDGQEFRHRSEKDTIERHYRKTLERQEGVGSGEPTAPDNITHLEEKRQKRETDPRIKAVKIGENHATTDHSTDSTLLPGEHHSDTVSEDICKTRQDDAASSQRHAQEAESELNTSKRKGKLDKPAIEPDIMAVIERWSEAMKKTYPMTDTLIKAATLLAPCQPSAEDLKKVRAFCFKSNPKWFRDERKGAVTLMDVAKNWEAWQSSLETSAPSDSEQDSTLGQYYYFTEAM